MSSYQAARIQITTPLGQLSPDGCAPSVCRCSLNITTGELRPPLDGWPRGSSELEGTALSDTFGLKLQTPHEGYPGRLGDPRKASLSKSARRVAMVFGGVRPSFRKE